jgi:hypothetical protein
MLYKDVKDCSAEMFKRLTGVKPMTFMEMTLFVTNYKQNQRKDSKRGRPTKLSIEDQLLMLLMYYREYRTFLHISKSYGISEMHCWRIITTTEKILLQSPSFHLPGKKALHNSNNNFEVIVVDVSEHPVERPQKNSNAITLAKRNGIR